MPSVPVHTIGIIGAGRVGTALARQALKAGYDVLLATSRPPSEIKLIVDFTAPGAKAVTAETAARDSDLVVITVPLGKYRTLRPGTFAGQIVVDAMNYWPPTDGTIPEFEGPHASSEVIQAFMPTARLVRTLNHIGYHELEEEGLPPGHPERRALAIAGNDKEARAVVAAFVDRLGYDPVDAGELRNSRKFVTGTRIFAGRHGRESMERLLVDQPARLEALQSQDAP
jgi:predicted dinucleotide-binding enzyme